MAGVDCFIVVQLVIRIVIIPVELLGIVHRVVCQWKHSLTESDC